MVEILERLKERAIPRLEIDNILGKEPDFNLNPTDTARCPFVSEMDDQALSISD